MNHLARPGTVCSPLDLGELSQILHAIEGDQDFFDVFEAFAAAVVFAQALAAEVLADGDVFHLRSNDALARVVHLADVLARFGAAWVAHVGEAHLGQLFIGQTALAELGGQTRQFLGVAAILDPGAAYVGQTLAHVDGDVRVGVGAGGVVDGDRGVDLAAEVGRRHVQADLAHRHADVRARAFDVDLARIGQRRDGRRVDVRLRGEEGVAGIAGQRVFGVHGSSCGAKGTPAPRNGAARFPTPA